MDTVYRPSVCHQTAEAHTHYNVVMVKTPSPDTTDLNLLRKLANKVGGQTAGQLISILLEKRAAGVDLNLYGIDFIKTETIPIFQICHKGEDSSPSIDWDTYLFIPYQEPPFRPPANPQIGRIRHS